MMSLVSPFINLYKLVYLFILDISGDYVLSLVLLSFVTFLFLLPFNRKARQFQSKERRIQAIIAPQIEAIKKRYSGQEQYEKLNRLYHRYAYHPIYAVRLVIGVLLQLPFLATAYYMLSGLSVIQGVSWGIISNLGEPDRLVNGINLLPFIMTFVTIAYAFVLPDLSKKERMQSVIIGLVFLVLLYNAPSALLIFWTSNLLWSLLYSVFEDKLQWISNYIEANELAFHIIFALSITFALLIPTDIYIKNAGQLWFDFEDILKFFLADTVKCFSILLLVYVFCWRNRAKSIYLSILLGLLFGLFLQSYIISIDYGVFDGHEIEWSKYTKIGLLNTFFWLFCLGETYVNFKRLNFDLEAIKKYVKPITFVLVVVQCVTLLINLKNNPIIKDIGLEDGRVGVLTTKNIYTVSEKNNILIFLIDAFDSDVFEEIQEKNPEIIQNFKDFTYYPDVTSSFGFTIYSVPEILTGLLFDPSVMKYPDFLNQAFNENPYYKILQDNNFMVDLYTSGDFVSKTASIDNLITERVSLDANMIDKFSGLVKFRMVPHFLKKLYYQYDPNLQHSMILNKDVQIYRFDDRAFYSGLKNGLQIAEKDNFFKFYHLEGVHYPWSLDENLEPLKEGEKGSARRASIGRLKVVSEFILQLKNYHIYDSSTIAILADHGHNHMPGRRPLFMIKQPKSDNTYLKVNTKPSKVSDLMNLVCRRFETKLDYDEEGRKKDRYYNKDRVFYLEDVNGGFIKYKIQGTAKARDSWIRLGRVEKYRGGDQNYHIGDVIDFSAFGNSDRYKGQGWSINPKAGYSDIKEFEADINLNIVDSVFHKTYTIKLRAHPILSAFDLPYKKLKLYANDVFIGNWRFERDDFEEVTCLIPKDLLKNRQLNLHFVVEVPENVKDDALVGGNVKFVVDKMQIVANND